MTPDHASHADAHVHVVPMKVLVGVWLALVLLTVVTVAASWVDFGHLIGEPWLNLAGALGIAVIKGSLVVLYFMHLRYENPFHGFVLMIALAFVALLIGITLLDAEAVQPNLIPDYAPALEAPAAPPGDAPPAP